MAPGRDAYVAGRDLHVHLPREEPGPLRLLPQMAVYYPCIHFRDERWLPRDLDQVPPAEIVKIRRRFSAQFDRWREYADEVGAQLAAQLREVSSPELLQAYLDDAVRKFATGPADELRNGLAAVGLDTATPVPGLPVAGFSRPGGHAGPDGPVCLAFG